MRRRGSSVWLSWHDHPRSHNLAQRLHLRLVVFDKYPKGLRRHVFGTIWTLYQLARTRPRTIFLQNSFLLTLVCAAYKSLPFFRETCIVVDCHNKSLKRQLQGPASRLFWQLKQWSFRFADAIIVSNEMLVPFARRLCSQVICLRDPLPELDNEVRVETSSKPSSELVKGNYALFVCSFEPDEPTDIILETASLVTRELGLASVITGRSEHLLQDRRIQQNSRVFAPGFVSRSDYISFLFGAAAVVVLTQDDDCLMCGAYESVSAEKPLVVSDTTILRKYFGKYAQFASHDPVSLCAAVRRAASSDTLKLRHAKTRMEKDFCREWDAFLVRLGSQCHSGDALS